MMETPGTILKREREARGLTLREIASITRIPTQSLQQIEEDRFECFPAEVFARGFLRNYARELELTSDEVILAYEALKSQRGLTAHSAPRVAESRRPAMPTAVPITSMIKPLNAERNDAPIRPKGHGARALKRQLSMSTSGEGRSLNHVPAVDTSQRTFRFAYVVVFLVVATSLGLSVLFTGTGDAQENQRRQRPVQGAEANNGSAFVSPDTTPPAAGALTTTPLGAAPIKQEPPPGLDLQLAPEANPAQSALPDIISNSNNLTKPPVKDTPR